ncbi:DUF58 domain-containing protein [Methylomarinum vadi]|uniref:DUF58 domain-containing protein n=1 Tax=Methylomarinum vadi TaxID=438855 RepID=UPI0004DFAB73|nr:DUF58 domain-containing protein [Methylomarinum vadi]
MSFSQRTLLLVGAVILVAIAGIWSGEPLAGAWRWPAALLLLTMVWERYRLPRDFRIDRAIAPSLALGRPAGYRLIVVNNGRRRVLLDYQPDYPAALVGDSSLRRFRVASAETLDNEISLTPVKLGTTRLGPFYIRVLGRYGLIWWSRRIDDRLEVVVEPDYLDRSALLRGLGGGGKRKSLDKPGTGYELLTLRDYRHGDSLHGVDWKATARRRQPMVRVFNQEQRLETAILVDCGRGGDIHYQLLDRLHHYVNVAARLSDYAVANGDQVAAVAYAANIVDRTAMAGGTAALQRIRKLLAGLSPLDQESNPLAMALALARQLRHRSLVVFLTEMEHANASGQLLQAVQLLAGKHHVLVASIEDDDVGSIVKQPAEHWMGPYRNLAALEYLRGRELTRAKLLRSGVSVVTASARAVDHEVLQLYRQLRERSAV